MKLVFAIPLALSHALFACETKLTTQTIEALLKQITHRHSRYSSKATEQLQSLIRQSPLGKYHTNPSNLVHHLTLAAKQFHEVPGFIRTFLETLQQQEGGHLYEIDIALSYAQNNQRVIAFNEIKKMPSRNIKREFDIIVKKQDHSEIWIECKCRLPKIKKNNQPNSIEKVRTQFVEQFSIAHTCAEKNGISISYIVHSQQPVSTEWQNWFNEHEIDACESDSSDYEYDSSESN